jgi:hypothetical protein
LKDERNFERLRPRRCTDRRDLRLRSKARVEAAPLPLLARQFHDLPSLRRLELISSREAVLASSRHRWPMHSKTPREHH